MNQAADVEQATGDIYVSTAAADHTGGTNQGFGETSGFEGVELYALDELIDRNEMGILVDVSHRLTAIVRSTTTADSEAHVGVEISTSGARQVASFQDLNLATDLNAGPADFDIDVGGTDFDDTLDLIGPVLTVLSNGGLTDGASGVGGAGGAGEDNWRGTPAATDFHPRDEVLLNGVIETNNLSDAGVDAYVDYQHTYAVFPD